MSLLISNCRLLIHCRLPIADWFLIYSALFGHFTNYVKGQLSFGNWQSAMNQQSAFGNLQ